jgi:uncharacterized protein
VPSLEWRVRGNVYVADQRGLEYLLVNRDTGAWAISNLAGVSQLEVARGSETLPEELRKLLRDTPGERPVAPSEDDPDSQPLILIYKLTDKCNYRCSYCYDRSIARPRDAERRSAAVREFLARTLPRRPVMLLFHGGEPLLEFEEIRRLVLDLSQWAPERLLYSLQTNLSPMNQEKMDFLLEHRFGISVSLDGHNPRMNRLRVVGGRPDPYELLKKKLRDLEGLRADRMGLLLTVGAHNVDQLTEALVVFQGDGFRSVSFSFMQDVEPGTECASPGALAQAMLDIARAIVDGRIDSLACMTLIQWVYRIAYGRSGYVCLGSPCGAGRTVATVLANGDIGACDSIYSDAFYRKDVDAYFEALARDPQFQHLRTRSVRTMQPCASCDVQAHCNGTCPGSANLETGGIQTVDPHECAFHYDLIRDMLWLLCDPESGPRLLTYCHRHIAEKNALGF